MNLFQEPELEPGVMSHDDSRLRQGRMSREEQFPHILFRGSRLELTIVDSSQRGNLSRNRNSFGQLYEAGVAIRRHRPAQELSGTGERPSRLYQISSLGVG